MATFSFNERYAMECGGSDAAVFICRLIYWLRENRANKRHFHDGHWWSYNTYEELADIFSWLSEQQLRRMIKKLEKDNVIIIGHYARNDNHESPPTRTNWYAFVDENKYLDDRPSVENEGSDSTPPKNTPKSKGPLPSVDNEGLGNPHMSKSTVPYVEIDGSTCAGINAVENLAVKNLKKAPLPPEESKNSKTASSVPEVEKSKPKSTNLPDPNNPRYAQHKRIAIAAYDQMGKTVLSSNPLISQLMGVIQDCTDCWTLEQQADLLPKVVQAMLDKGQAIRSLPGFLRYKGRGSANDHPYGEALARERPEPAKEDFIEALDLEEAISDVLAGKVLDFTPKSKAAGRRPLVNPTIDYDLIRANLGPKKKRKRKPMTDEERRAMLLRIDPSDAEPTFTDAARQEVAV